MQIRKKQVPRHPNDVNEFNNDKDIITSPTTLHANGLSNGNGMDVSKKSWSQQTLINADGSRVKKKYKKSALNTSSSNHSSNNNNTNNLINGNGIASNGPNSNNQMNSASGTVCNGIRKERSLHYCSICSKGFKDKYSVNVHIRTHTGEKVNLLFFHSSKKSPKFNIFFFLFSFTIQPFQCSLCGKSFRQKAHLAKHYQTHLQKNTNGSVKSKHHQKHHNAIANSTPSSQTTTTLNVINVVAGR